MRWGIQQELTGKWKQENGSGTLHLHGECALGMGTLCRLCGRISYANITPLIAYPDDWCVFCQSTVESTLDSYTYLWMAKWRNWFACTHLGVDFKEELLRGLEAHYKVTNGEERGCNTQNWAKMDLWTYSEQGKAKSGSKQSNCKSNFIIKSNFNNCS